ncbi:hypothetical protein Tco_0095694, partial [Tanacetum coccineum]
TLHSQHLQKLLVQSRSPSDTTDPCEWYRAHIQTTNTMSGLDALRYIREPTIPRKRVGSISLPPLSSSRLGRSAIGVSMGHADKRRKPLEFSVGDYVLLKLLPWKSVVRLGKKGKLAPRFVRPFEIIEKVGPVAYRLDLLEELNSVHDTFHVSNLKKCLADPTLQVPLDEIRVDAKLNFVEEP